MKKRKIRKQTIKVSLKITVLEAAGGIVFTSGEFLRVLLIKRNGYWDIPKGKLEKNESIEECALREVCEETGIEDIRINSYLCETYHIYKREDLYYGKKTYWYSMEVADATLDLYPQSEEGITEVKWVELQEAEIMVEYENLRDLLQVFKKERSL